MGNPVIVSGGELKVNSLTGNRQKISVYFHIPLPFSMLSLVTTAYKVRQ
jgi:hypothetical protein